MLTILDSNYFSHTAQFSLGRNVWKQYSSLWWCARIAAGVLRQLSRTIHLPFYFSTVRAHADSPSYAAPPRLASNCNNEFEVCEMHLWGACECFVVFRMHVIEFEVCEMRLWGTCDVFVLYFACISTNLTCVRCVFVVFWLHFNVFWGVREVVFVENQKDLNKFEVCGMCFWGVVWGVLDGFPLLL